MSANMKIHQIKTKQSTPKITTVSQHKKNGQSQIFEWNPIDSQSVEWGSQDVTPEDSVQSIFPQGL